MDPARYEVRLNGRLSERACGAFCAMDVKLVPPQTILFGELAEQSDLRDLLALCSAMVWRWCPSNGCPLRLRHGRVEVVPGLVQVEVAVSRPSWDRMLGGL